MDAPPQGIGLGFPGAVDPRMGIVMLPGKLKLEGFPIVPRLENATGIPVIADNDGRIAILAEAHSLAHEHTAIPVEPTGSAGLAGLLELQNARAIGPDETVAALFTGVERGG